MMNFKRPLLSIALVCMASLLPGAVRESLAHPFHVSFAEVEWNAETGKLEVALQLDPDDLEQAVRRDCGKRIIIDHEGSAKAIEDYIRKNFSIAPKESGKKTGEAAGKDKKKRFHWVGSEIRIATMTFNRQKTRRHVKLQETAKSQ